MSPSLNTGLTLSHFRILAPLGEGGMGEVYKAWDSKLEREVALKVLPPDRVGDGERLSRFVQEAKSASALGHPHIITIHEIGQESVQVEGQDSPVLLHYIAMELVEGPTLQRLIHQDRASLRTLLGHLAQAAEGVARAHEAGVVHRDLKPENIMVTRDGYAKVLDFGLAKLHTLADPGDADSDPDAATAFAATAEGMVMGTVGYMSPEQAQGRPVDHRTDVFSFGCLLYEAVTRRRPFIADSSIDVLYKILHESPPPMEELNPNVPGALRRLVNRCLAKDPDRRAQSMKDLALELGELVAEFDSLAPTSSGMSVAHPALRAPARSPRAVRWAVGAVLGALLVGGGWWLAARPPAPDASPAPRVDAFQAMRIEPLTSEGTITRGALSPDGRYLALTRSQEGRVGLWIRQVSTGSEVEVVAPMDLGIRGVVFSPDGEHLYFVRSVPDQAGYNALYRVPTLGGEPRQISFDVDASVTFSPDGERFAFPRGIPQENRSAILVADADGSDLSELASVELPDRFPLAPAAWSPSGETVVVLLQGADDLFALRPMAIDVATGALEPFPGGHRFTAISGLVWLPDGAGVVIVGRREVLESGDQIWFIEYPSGELRRISNDVNDYGPPSTSQDGSTLATVLTETEAHLYAVPVANRDEVRQLTRSRREIAVDVAAGPDAVIFLRRQGDRIELLKTTLDGEPQRLAAEGILFDPTMSADGRVLLAARIGVGEERPHVWRLDPDSGGLVEQLTDGPGEASLALSPDGEWFFYNEVGSQVLWRRAVAGGEPVAVADRGGSPRVSPAGDLLVYAGFGELDGQPAPVLTIATVEGETRQQLAWDPGTNFFWHPAGDALVVERRVERVSNLWRVPLDGSEPEQLTRFEEGFILGADWSPDGEWIFVTRGETASDVVLIHNFR